MVLLLTAAPSYNNAHKNSVEKLHVKRKSIRRGCSTKIACNFSVASRRALTSQVFVHTLRHFSDSVLEPDWHELCSVIYTFRRSDAKFACKFSDVGKRFLFSQFFD